MKQNFGNNVSIKKEDNGIGAYCVPIPFQDFDDEANLLVAVEKKKGNQNYNMRCRCEQRLIRHFNQGIKTTETAKFEQSSIAHVVTCEELHLLSTTKGLQVLYLSCPRMTEVQ